MMFNPSFLARMLNPHGLVTQVQIIRNPAQAAFPEMNVPVERIIPEEDWYRFTFTGYKPGRNPRRIGCTIVVQMFKA